MEQESKAMEAGISRQAEEQHLADTLAVIRDNVENYGSQVRQMRADIDEMLEHYHDNDTEVLTLLNNTITLHDHMKRALEKNIKAQNKPYFGRIVFYDEALHKEESIYIGKGGISQDATHQLVADWRAPVANVYYENGLGKCSYTAPDGEVFIDLKRKRTYEIEEGKLLDYFDSEVVANDELLTKYLSKNKQAVLGEIVATIQKEQNEIIRRSPYHNIIVQGVAGSGKTTVAMHRISYILYNYAERFQPNDFYIVGSNRILLEYITGVLPDLDVYEVRQMTMEQLFIRLLYEDWDDQKYRICRKDRVNSRGSVKGSLRWFGDLSAYCDRLEWETIPRDSIYLNPKQFVEGFQDGKTGVFDRTGGRPASPEELVLLMDKEAVERYIRQNPTVSVQSKINMLNQRLSNKVTEEFLGKGIKYTEAEKKAIRKAYRGRYGNRTWKRSIYDLYRDFLKEQQAKGVDVPVPAAEFDVYDLAALAFLYKRVKETEVISEAHHVVIDEAQDFGMMAYCVLKFCIKDCTYTIMGDVSQNIHFGYGLNDWEELKELLLTDPMDSFCLLKKSYRNTVEISHFATAILDHGHFPTYPVEPIIRHGKPVRIQQSADRKAMIREAACLLQKWQANGYDTMAVVCRDSMQAAQTAKELQRYVPVMESNLEKAVFGSGILVLPVEYTKGLEFDTVLILDPDREDYPVDDGHARLLYVAATRALHELCVLHTGSLTGLIADPVPEKGKDCPPRELPASLPKSSPLSHKTVPDALDSEAADEKAALLAAKLKKNLSRGQTAVAAHSAFTEKQQSTGTVPSFGDMPATEKLRPAGHSRIDLAVRWCTRQADGLYLQSRYGILRLCPVSSSVIRVTFAKGASLAPGVHPSIAVSKPDRSWMYREGSNGIELLTDELCLRIDKPSGALRFLTRDKKLLLAERRQDSRQLEASPSGKQRAWLFLDWLKNEHLYCFHAGNKKKWELSRTARYISYGDSCGELPFLLSDQGYGILMAADGPAICCALPAYGPYLYAEEVTQLDYYFAAGNQTSVLLNAYAWLRGKQ